MAEKITDMAAYKNLVRVAEPKAYPQNIQDALKHWKALLISVKAFIDAVEAMEGEP